MKKQTKKVIEKKVEVKKVDGGKMQKTPVNFFQKMIAMRKNKLKK